MALPHPAPPRSGAPRTAPPRTGLTGAAFGIAAGPFTATIAEVGAGLRGLTRNGVDITVGYGDDQLPPKGCGATLVPWPNRLRGGRYTFDGAAYQMPITEPALGNANHGLARWARWSPTHRTADAITLGCDIVPQSGWPFQLRAEVTYRLDAARGLVVTARATNIGMRRAPFGMGFHPFLATYGQPIDQVRLKLPARQLLITDEAQIPVGTRTVSGSPHDLRRGRRLGALRLDDAFTELRRIDGRAAVEVITRSGSASLWLDEAFGWVQIFTVGDLQPGRAGIAVEPMSCPADAFNSGVGLVILDPGAAWTGSWGIEPL